MTFKFGPLGIQSDNRYRNLPEASIIEMVRLMGWACEVESGMGGKAAAEALQAWIDQGLNFRRAPEGERLFDPVEVTNFMKRAGLDGRDDFWVERYVGTHRRHVSDLADTVSSSPSAGGERRFVVDFSRRFHLGSVAPGSKLRLRMPLPLTGDYLQDLQVAPFAEATGEVQISLNPGRLEARMVAAGQAEAVVGARLSFTALPQEPRPGQESTGPDLSLYLGSDEGLIVVSERIRALARSLATPGAPALDAVRAFWEFIIGEFCCGALHYDQIDFALPCDWILDSGWFDCQLGSALFVALCRAHGIPSRLIGGHLLYQASPTNHYWAEVWIDDQGWTPFDFLGWDLSKGGREHEWRDRFFGRLDYRLTCQRMPREFTGALGLPIPPAWCILQIPSPGGVEISFVDIAGTPVYVDTICVTA